jgi:hypothetical protein
MDTTFLILIALDDPRGPLAESLNELGAATATKVEPRQVLRIDEGRKISAEDRRRKMIRDTEDYLSNPLSESWARLSSLRPRATMAVAC